MPSYTNAIDTREVSLAIEQVLIAPFGTVTWDPSSGRINVASVPAGFVNLGAVVEDSPVLTITREIYSLKTGLPKVIQYQALMGLGGSFDFSLYSRSPRKIQYALGNAAPLNILGAQTTVASVFASSLTVVVASIAPPAAGAWLVTNASSAGTPGLQQTDNEAMVASATTGTSFTTITFASAANYFQTAPIVGQPLAQLISVINPFGLSTLRKFHVLGVADFIDGYQVVHEFRQVQNSGEFKEQISPKDVAHTPIKYELLGYATSRYPGMTNELIVGERFWFPGV